LRGGKLAYVDERLADITTWTAANAGVGTAPTCHDISSVTMLYTQHTSLTSTH